MVLSIISIITDSTNTTDILVLLYSGKQGSPYKSQMSIVESSGGSKGVRGMPQPRGPNSVNFTQFLGNFGKIVCWRPPSSEGWCPHLAEIRID